jgi:hypothetical protein
MKAENLRRRIETLLAQRVKRATARNFSSWSNRATAVNVHSPNSFEQAVSYQDATNPPDEEETEPTAEERRGDKPRR